MMIDSIHLHTDKSGLWATGWLVSCLLHGSLALAATLFVQRMQLAPQTEPFKWNVAMAAPSSQEATEPPARAKTALAPALQRPTPPMPTARPVTESPQKRVETTAIPPQPLVAPVVEKPAPITPATPPPSITEIAPNPATPSKPEPIAPPAPPVVTSSPNDQPSATYHPIDTHVASTPHDPVPVTSASAAPHPSAASTEPTPPAHVNPAIAPVETQAALPPAPAPGPQVAALAPVGQPKPAKVDYGWLSDLMARWIEDLDKRYPAMLRTDGIQGKVTLMAVLHEDGVLSDVRVAKSSGNTTLDEVAVEDVKKGPPIRLPRPLDKPQMPVKFSIIYDLKTAR